MKLTNQMERCTKSQENYIRILFNDIELGERLFQLKFIENELGVVVSYLEELSKISASKLINSLKRIKEQKREEENATKDGNK